MYHEKLSNIGASLAMPLILTAVLRHFSLPEIYQAVLVVVAMVLSIRGKRSEGCGDAHFEMKVSMVVNFSR